MLSLIFMLSMFGCGDKIEDTSDGVVIREEDQVPDLNPDDQPWGYEPDMVLFHNVTVIGDGDIACFDDGDGSPYCGVYKIYLTVWEDWDGVGDQGSCEITHRVAPEYVIESTATEDLVGVGALAGWEMDATQSFVATSAMCDFIREETPAHSVLERFKAENLIWGITMPSEDMVTEYREMKTGITDEEWAEEVVPYLGAFVNKIGDEYRVPNFSVAFQTDENNIPVTNSEGSMTAGPMDDSELVNGYYRAAPFYVYGLDRFIVGE